MTEPIVIGDIRPRIQAIGDGTQTEFIYPFPIFKSSDLEVYLDETLQSAGYSVSGAGTSDGGSVIFDIAPLNGVTITLVRHLKIERTSDFSEGGAFHANVINQELDYIVAVSQQNAEAISRCLGLHTTDGEASLVLPAKDERLNRVLAFDLEGVPIAGPDASEILNVQANAQSATEAAILAQAAQIAAEDARDQALTFNPALYREVADPITTTDVADGAITQAKIDPSVILGGPSVGNNSVIRTNDKIITENITLGDHLTTFTVNTLTDTLEVGSNNGFANGDTVYLETLGVLPSGLALNTEYFVVNVTASTLQLASTFAGTPIVITNTGSGSHAIYQAVNGMSAGPITIAQGSTVTIKQGSTWTIVGGN